MKSEIELAGGKTPEQLKLDQFQRKMNRKPRPQSAPGTGRRIRDGTGEARALSSGSGAGAGSGVATAGTRAPHELIGQGGAAGGSGGGASGDSEKLRRGSVSRVISERDQLYGGGVANVVANIASRHYSRTGKFGKDNPTLGKTVNSFSVVRGGKVKVVDGGGGGFLTGEGDGAAGFAAGEGHLPHGGPPGPDPTWGER